MPENAWGVEERCVYYVDGREVGNRLIQRLIFGTRLLTQDDLAGTRYARYPDVRVTVTIEGAMLLRKEDVLLSVLDDEGLIEDCFRGQRLMGSEHDRVIEGLPGV
jgi:hypothetical protein